MTFFTTDQIKEANRELGDHYFDRDTMRFFGSRVLSGVYGGRYFVTSERDSGISINGERHAAWNGQRRYSVRLANPDGSVDTVGDFGTFNTAAQARATAKRLAKQAAMQESGERFRAKIEK